MAKFNVFYYRQLLEKTDSSITKNKNLFNDPIFLELLDLKASVETQILYNHKDKYFALIQQYLSKTINPNVFRGDFIGIINKDLEKASKILNNLNELSTFWVDSELEHFSSLFEDMHEVCLYAFEFEDEEGAMPEDKFRDSIIEIFTQMQPYL